MNLAVVGTGYVGLVSGTCFAEMGNQVVCVDNLEEKVERLNRSEIPIYEPGLKELVRKNKEAGHLCFTTDIGQAVRQSDVILIAVGTPETETGAADLSYVYAVAEEIGAELDETYKVIVNKSTVPVGTAEAVERIIQKRQPSASVDVCSVPEFLREGSAVKDTFHPDRVVIGGSSQKATEILTELHQPLTDKLVVTDTRSSEMTKYASNAFLATKISFINEIANICDIYDADVNAVAEGMGLDHRIGPKFLNAGIGYGGSCFPKDVKALKYLAEEKEYHPNLLQAVNDVNEQQNRKMVDHLLRIFDEEVQGLTVAILGLAFKPNTDDIREAPALKIIQELADRGVHIRAFDPVATENAKQMITADITYTETAVDAINGADAAFLVTEWDECKSLTSTQFKDHLKRPVVIDGRNALDVKSLKADGIIYHGIGRK
ncbi:UDP-glucose/GDP-mannose dehydrogenase family protein [Salibacterium salarium]|uniref:UDP-glucose 6-dehydrogenase n=1 Tax=Salibacterium salarium TaxID=284579 RepID=A0A3R9WWM9_9BACI|nr:UDP-glucose/GDP-mannose dehydrogenase family protein [Salibacterium salarium]RSL35142.1 UDP-glucose/GDP-mannose dehydrogenase family protein [Salibacterium salarium]